MTMPRFYCTFFFLPRFLSLSEATSLSVDQFCHSDAAKDEANKLRQELLEASKVKKKSHNQTHRTEQSTSEATNSIDIGQNTDRSQAANNCAADSTEIAVASDGKCLVMEETCAASGEGTPVISTADCGVQTTIKLTHFAAISRKPQAEDPCLPRQEPQHSFDSSAPLSPTPTLLPQTTAAQIASLLKEREKLIDSVWELEAENSRQQTALTEIRVEVRQLLESQSIIYENGWGGATLLQGSEQGAAMVSLSQH